MPPNLQSIDMLKAGILPLFFSLFSIAITFVTNEMFSCATAVPEPCLDSFVFLRVKEKQENILIEPETDDQRYQTTFNLQDNEMISTIPPAGGEVLFRMQTKW